MNFVHENVITGFKFSEDEPNILQQALEIVNELHENMFNTNIDTETKELIVETKLCLCQLYDTGTKEN